METEETTGVKFELGPSSSEKKKNRRPKHVRRVDQDALDAYDEAGRCYERGDYETAVKHYTSCLNSAPQGWSLAAKALGNRGAARTMLGRHDDALNDCDAGGIEPGLAKVHNRSARAQARVVRMRLAEPSARARRLQ